MILDKIVDYKKDFVKERKQNNPLNTIERNLLDIAPPLNFKKALLNSKTTPAVIAEVKKASPSKGLIRPDFSYLNFALSYEKNNAAAVSVLTDEKFFQGSDEYLKEIKQHTKIPVLRKDFIIDEYQIFESRMLGADAILLIVKCLSQKQIKDYYRIASSLKMSALVEVHDKHEAQIALEAGVDIIGVNNRNLDTFEVDLNTTKQISAMIPNDIVFVSESGIKKRADVEFLNDSDIDAILVGETLMRFSDPGSGIHELVNLKQ